MGIFSYVIHNYGIYLSTLGITWGYVLMLFTTLGFTWGKFPWYSQSWELHGEMFPRYLQFWNLLEKYSHGIHNFGNYLRKFFHFIHNFGRNIAKYSHACNYSDPLLSSFNDFFNSACCLIQWKTYILVMKTTYDVYNTYLLSCIFIVDTRDL